MTDNDTKVRALFAKYRALPPDSPQSAFNAICRQIDRLRAVDGLRKRGIK